MHRTSAVPWVLPGGCVKLVRGGVDSCKGGCVVGGHTPYPLFTCSGLDNGYTPITFPSPFTYLSAYKHMYMKEGENCTLKKIPNNARLVCSVKDIIMCDPVCDE